jgi:hypothetical protein
MQLLSPRFFTKYEILVTELLVPYPVFKETPDMLEIFSADEIERLRHNPSTFFLFDYTGEGNSYKEYINFFHAIEFSAAKYNIPLYKMFFISSNLADEYNCKNKNINVISFNKWDYFPKIKNIDIKPKFTDETHFLNLNRVIRYFRILTTLKLVNSSIKDNLKISYDFLSLDLLQATSETHYAKTGKKLDSLLLENLSRSSPRILDRTDFHINWVDDMPKQLFDSSINSLVGETLYESLENTSIFYSEKSFKPMIFNHPVCIFGQPYANKNLATLGYKTYEKFFDLEFDSIEDYSQRLDSQVSSLEKLNDQLLSMSNIQKFDWYMQGIDIIQHNKQTLKEQNFNKKKARIFLELLKQYTS